MFTATPQRKRVRSEQSFHSSSSLHDTPLQETLLQNVKNDIISSCPSSSEGNATAMMVSPFLDHRISDADMISSSSSPMTARLEPLIESEPNEEESNNAPGYYAAKQQQQQLQLTQTSLVSTASSVINYASSIHNNSSIAPINNVDCHQPPLKRLKVDQCEGPDQEMQDDDVNPVEDRRDEKPPSRTQSSKHVEHSLMKKLMEGGNNALATASKRNDVSHSNTSGVVYCHVCGGQGDDDATKQSGVKTGECNIGSSNSTANRGSSSCASRSIASYFKVTKKQQPSSSKPPPQSSQPPPPPSKKVSSQQNITTSPNNDTQHLSPCRYCDRPTCNNNPSCIKQCEECQHNFCSFCCKVNYDGVYEKTVCFECDELIMLSHCCDRMEL